MKREGNEFGLLTGQTENRCDAFVQEVVLTQQTVERAGAPEHDMVFVSPRVRRKIDVGTARDCHNHPLAGRAGNQLHNMHRQNDKPPAQREQASR